MKRVQPITPSTVACPPHWPAHRRGREASRSVPLKSITSSTSRSTWASAEHRRPRHRRPM